MAFARFIIPCLIVLGGIGLRAFLARQNLAETGVSFRGFQTWIYYPTWTRLDPLVFGVVWPRSKNSVRDGGTA